MLVGQTKPTVVRERSTRAVTPKKEPTTKPPTTRAVKHDPSLGSFTPWDWVTGGKRSTVNNGTGKNYVQEIVNSESYTLLTDS